MHNHRIIISGGGTGGHIFPAIAIAKALHSEYPDCAILFVGAKGKMEMEQVPLEGFDIKGLWISGLQRSLSASNLLFPIKVIFSIFKAFQILSEFKPTIVIGTGGYASAAVMYAAAMKKIPCFIQEQNSFPGITNKFLAKYARKIFVAYDGLDRFLPKEKLVITGNPMRCSLADIDQKRNEALDFFRLDNSKKTLLVLGGSLGASAINKFVEKRMEFFDTLGLQLVWQCGKLYAENYLPLNNKPKVGVYSFIKDMELAYAAADFIISRAGALSVSELALVGKPVIFVPSPNVAEDHQTKNAQTLARTGAAIVIAENELERVFDKTFTDLIASETQQKAMKQALKTLGKPEAAKDIVNHIIAAIQ